MYPGCRSPRCAAGRVGCQARPGSAVSRLSGAGRWLDRRAPLEARMKWSGCCSERSGLELDQLTGRGESPAQLTVTGRDVFFRFVVHSHRCTYWQSCIVGCLSRAMNRKTAFSGVWRETINSCFACIAYHMNCRNDRTQRTSGQRYLTHAPLGGGGHILLPHLEYS